MILSSEYLSFTDTSSLYHYVAAKGAISMFFDNPIYGVGMGNQQQRAMEYLDYSFLSIAELAIVPHNLFLEILSENGLIGATLFMMIIYKLSTKYKNFRQVDFSVIFLTAFLPSMTLTYTYEPLFWLGMSIAAADTKLQREKDRTKEHHANA